jgi:hypothetical protein
MELSKEDEEILAKFFGPSELSALKKKLSGRTLTNAEHQAWLRIRKHFDAKQKLVEELVAIDLLGEIMGWKGVSET